LSAGTRVNYVIFEVLLKGGDWEVSGYFVVGGVGGYYIWSNYLILCDRCSEQHEVGMSCIWRETNDGAAGYGRANPRVHAGHSDECERVH